MEGRHRRVRVKLVPLLVAMAGGAAAAWALKGGALGNRTPETPAGGDPALVTARLLASPPGAPPSDDGAGGLPAPSASRDPVGHPAAAPAPPAAPAPLPADGVPAGDAAPEADAAGGAGDGPPAEPEPPPPPSGSAQVEVVSPSDKLRFREIWAYLMPGEESRWAPEAPITDLGLFDFSLDPTGRLKGKANQKAIERAAARGIRTHLVIASSGNKSLLHFALSPRYGVRQALLADLLELPRRHRVNGVQLDLEGPRAEDREDLLSFIGELRKQLPAGIVFSLALPAKTVDSDGAFRYRDLAGLADRFFIMTYDQHWRGGPPGAISELAWHDRVLACARTHLGTESVVVGLPFYGRVWQREEVARALKHSQAGELAGKLNSPIRRDPARSNSFTFRTEVSAECWFEDSASLRAKLGSAQAKGFRNVGFWRLGQEDPQIWKHLERE